MCGRISSTPPKAAALDVLKASVLKMDEGSNEMGELSALIIVCNYYNVFLL